MSGEGISNEAAMGGFINRVAQLTQPQVDLIVHIWPTIGSAIRLEDWSDNPRNNQRILRDKGNMRCPIQQLLFNGNRKIVRE